MKDQIGARGTWMWREGASRQDIKWLPKWREGGGEELDGGEEGEREARKNGGGGDLGEKFRSREYV